MSFLAIQHLHKSFGGLHAVNDVSFALAAGEIKALIGPNGAGKTTLLNLLSGNILPDAGEVIFLGKPIQGLKPFQIARRGMARTFQNIKLFPEMTALENVMVGRHMRSRSGVWSGAGNLPWTWKEEAGIRRKSLELMEFMGIAEHAGTEAASLAFGQQRAVEFARALALEPDLLLLDEPAAGLNIYETAELAKLIRKVRDRGITILLVEHDMSLVMDISDSIVVLSFGRRIAEGNPLEIQNNPEVIQIYLGEDDA
ncbi:MAG: high-affinity branched-chain amino acid ABC transporter ATP-binding protein LivG [Deltaproteobacteria bacterium CG_4_10_14_3_um_filter_60_8]|nr:MAG: high-affinity branched-chain amino acid ABC transporter ATP-binding protein LivG [Desulfobacterales bacterium CG2_30_60_27]PIP42838.1 MAG: high-affinity branched-chain amino acid ABC transporter ATP-binding protein LivG [Deltaproteobacteria bacterium CG23_combo_of_CG06-09_8_20_14_all_60_8]PIY24002.1 MAG: high-affinity branched-chain amino acid ABC transporter ATP-binding protein LivG [Deltaproteobacteria bacterium CG_4_10_14_3_um_filter_60_8]